MPDLVPTSYDEFPYDADNVFAYTRPECQGAVAALFGLTAAAPARCRVLELGCGTGGNLIPMALDLPGSHFVGFDLSVRQIDAGRGVVQALGLTNIELRALDIMAIDEGLGQFDYIVCHGVYSWVPAAVQDKILAICKNHLQANGVAYVSYNTYPGWHLRGMIREMMGYHVRQFDDPHEKVAQARALLHFLAETVGERNQSYHHLLQFEEKILAEASDTYLFHEHLEDVNAPVYFHEFARRAAAQGLQYLAEAQPSALVKNLSADACATIQRMSGSLIQGEQYLDFVRNRTFRRTLLCHQETPLQRQQMPEKLLGLCLTGLAKSVADDACPTAVQPEEFRTREGNSLTTNNPLLRSALHVLQDAWPGALTFDELWERAQTRLGPNDAGARGNLAQAMLDLYLATFLELHTRKFGLTLVAGARPCASPLARLQAASTGSPTNLRHRGVELDPFDRLVLQQLDGTRDRTALVDFLAGLVADGVLEAQDDAQRSDGPAALRHALEQSLDASLHRISRSALLLPS